MGYVYISSSRIIVNVGTTNRKFLKSHGRRGIFLANLSLFLSEKLGFRIETDPYGRTTVYVNGKFEEALEKILELDTLDRTGKGVVMWLLSVWDTLKKHGIDKYISLEEMLSLY